MSFDGHTHSDSIGLAELGPDFGVLLASLVLPRYFGKFHASPGYQQISKTLSEQFMPDKSGKGVEDEILFNEMLMFFDPPGKKKVIDLLGTLSKDERRFFINTLALWAAKYQKERKAAKGADGKEQGGTAFMEPLAEDNPAVKFLKQIAEGVEGKSIEEMVEELRHSGMIQKSLKDKFLLKWKEHQEQTGKEAVEILSELITEWSGSQTKQKLTVGPLGFLFAYALGKGDTVEHIGAATIKALAKRAFDRSKSALKKKE